MTAEQKQTEKCAERGLGAEIADSGSIDPRDDEKPKTTVPRIERYRER